MSAGMVRPGVVPLSATLIVGVPVSSRLPAMAAVVVPGTSDTIEPAGVSELLAIESAMGLATLLLKTMLNGPVPVTKTLPAPTLGRVASAFWMLAASVAGVPLQLIAPVVWPA